MLFSEEVISHKLFFLDSILLHQDLLENTLKKILKETFSIKPISRLWNPGGGSSLFQIITDQNKYFLKVKHKSILVESRLESELSFCKNNSLLNEYLFYKDLDVDFVPKIQFFAEEGDFCFLALEWLEPFSEAIKRLDAWSLLESWKTITESVKLLFKRNILHTDIHEGNILFRGNIPVICDFEEARYLEQKLEWSESLDMIGINKYGNVGMFPVLSDDAVKGYTCLDRLRKVYGSIIKSKFVEFMSSCNFDNNCPFNADDLQEPDDRIYQSIIFDDLIIPGQRPVGDVRNKLLAILLGIFGKKHGQFTFLDIGSNMGTFCIEAARNTYVRKAIGIEAYDEYIKASQLLEFITGSKNTEFIKFVAGKDKISTLNTPIDFVSMLSVYHHISEKDTFLDDLSICNPKFLLAEFATQDRYYRERGNLQNEIPYIMDKMSFNYYEYLLESHDYRRPIYLFSNDKLSAIDRIRIRMMARNRNQLLPRITDIIGKYLKKVKYSPPSSGKNILPSYNKALEWIDNNSTSDGILISSKQRTVYPEVTGYFIPSLLRWGYKEKALGFAWHLANIQNSDGSWSDPSGKSPYTFDTGQILKGLLALADDIPELENHILKGCNWILSHQKSDGRIITPDASQWGGIVPESIHLYALEPIKEAGKRWGKDTYIHAVDRALEFYLPKNNLIDFQTLSHFHAYIIEALVDLGEIERARVAMGKIASLQRRDGSIPAYPDKHWICSPGLMQYALIWYKLGIVDRADKAFHYACKLQNESGGFYGSYGRKAQYFTDEEISWAVKYFLDAYYWKIKTSFDRCVDLLPNHIAKNDGRYQLVLKTAAGGKPFRVLDIGCGKGRFIKNLIEDLPGIQAFGIDLSEKLLAYLPQGITSKQGSMLNIPFSDECFDYAYCIEAMEHAVNIPMAIKEMCRVIAKDGTLLIIDKDIEKKGKLEIDPWEQWFDERRVACLLEQEGLSVQVIRNVPYERSTGEDGLFIGWLAKKK